MHFSYNHVLSAQDEDNAHNLLRKLNEVYFKWRKQVNLHKTEYTVFGSQSRDLPMDGEIVKANN